MNEWTQRDCVIPQNSFYSHFGTTLFSYPWKREKSYCSFAVSLRALNVFYSEVIWVMPFRWRGRGKTTLVKFYVTLPEFKHNF